MSGAIVVISLIFIAGLGVGFLFWELLTAPTVENDEWES